MVMCTCVRGSTLARLATVLVFRAGGKPSTWFPPGTRRADNLFLGFFYFLTYWERYSNPEFLTQLFFLKMF